MADIWNNFVGTIFVDGQRNFSKGKYHRSSLVKELREKVENWRDIEKHDDVEIRLLHVRKGKVETIKIK